MKKVRVLKEIHFAKVGEEFELKEVESYKFGVGESDYMNITINPTAFSSAFSRSIKIKDLIQDGWLEWVEEEKSLEEKFKMIVGNETSKEAFLVAKEHYQKKFDEALAEWRPTVGTNLTSHEWIRKARFGEK